MKFVSVAELKEQGYKEDPEGRKHLEAPYRVVFWCMIIVFVGSLLAYVFTSGHLRSIFGYICGISFLLFFPVVLSSTAIMHYSTPRSRHSGEPLGRYRNSDYEANTRSDVVYVCPVSKTYFSVKVLLGIVEGEEAPISEQDLRDAGGYTEPEMPDGFVQSSLGSDAIIIHHKRTGMGCMNIFLILFLVIWTWGCLTVVSNAPGLFRAFFWGCDLLVACTLTYMLFWRTTFRVDGQELTVLQGIWGVRMRKVFPKESILRLIQVKDGGQDFEDSFPSWGLRLQGERNATLLFRQPYDYSHWLGSILSERMGVEFLMLPQEK